MFKCNLCNLELKNRGHVCGVQDTPHKVEIMWWWLWWNPMMWMSWTKDKSVS